MKKNLLLNEILIGISNENSSTTINIEYSVNNFMCCVIDFKLRHISITIFNDIDIDDNQIYTNFVFMPSRFNKNDFIITWSLNVNFEKVEKNKLLIGLKTLYSYQEETFNWNTIKKYFKSVCGGNFDRCNKLKDLKEIKEKEINDWKSMNIFSKEIG